MKDAQAGQTHSGVPVNRRLPLTIWALGLGSLLMDTSSELLHSLTPVLLVNVLEASVVSVGLIEGIAEGTASVTKVFAGAISDYFRRRKTLIAWLRFSCADPSAFSPGSVGTGNSCRALSRSDEQSQPRRAARCFGR